MKKLGLLTTMGICCLSLFFIPHRVNAEAIVGVGSGLVWSDGCDEHGCYNNAQRTDITVTVNLFVDLFDVYWQVDLSIDELGIYRSYAIRQHEGFLGVDEGGFVVKINADTCWGCDCPVDEAYPDDCGSASLRIMFELSNLSGYIGARSNSNGPHGHSNWRFQGELTFTVQ